MQIRGSSENTRQPFIGRTKRGRMKVLQIKKNTERKTPKKIQLFTGVGSSAECPKTGTQKPFTGNVATLKKGKNSSEKTIHKTQEQSHFIWYPSTGEETIRHWCSGAATSYMPLIAMTTGAPSYQRRPGLPRSLVDKNPKITKKIQTSWNLTNIE